MAFSLLSLYLLSTSFVATELALGLEGRSTPVSMAALKHAQLLVVPGAGRRPPAVEYDNRERPSALATERLLYAAYLSRRSGLELALSGGRVVVGERESEAALMARQLQQELALPVRWQEGASRTTRENAHNTRALLPQSIQRIALVTHAMHMPRARYAFEQAGFEVIAAPLGYHPRNQALSPVLQWLPTARGLLLSRDVLHEWLGEIWYRLQDRLFGDYPA